MDDLEQRIIGVLDGLGPDEALSPGTVAIRASAPLTDVLPTLRALWDIGAVWCCPDGWGWYDGRFAPR
jgi:hypothetical protein